MKLKVKQILIIALIAIGINIYAEPKSPRNLDNVKKERQATTKAIRETSKKIDATEKKTARSLNELNTLNAEIVQQTGNINRLSVQLDSIDSAINLINDSISSLDKQLITMRDSYVTSIKKIKSAREGSMSTLAFIFSSESFMQAYRRMRYLNEFSKWRQRKADGIKEVQTQLDEKRQSLAHLQSEKNTSISKINLTKADLERKKKDTSVLVSQLKKESASLKQVLKQKEAQARALDRELDRLIAEEQHRQEEERRRIEAEKRRKEQEELKRLAAAEAAKNKSKDASESSDKSTAEATSRPEPAASSNVRKSTTTSSSTSSTSYAMAEEDRKLSGSFEANKGNLLFPVSGQYKIVRTFGRQQHPDLPYVTTDNAGIDIEVPSGANARAVFGGKVSAIFRQPGFNTIVMVRHGSYLTIYANLSDISVKNGDTLRQGQTIGRIFSDPDDSNRTILHFELRKEKEKLNPSAWVK
jgi:septal ring factor EnvC (AmiA/AmiB activator)